MDCIYMPLAILKFHFLVINFSYVLINIIYIYYNFSHILQVMNFSIVGDGLEINSSGNLKNTGLDFK